MEDDKFFEFENKIRSETNNPALETKKPTTPLKIKKDEISEIRSIRDFVAWFVSWEFKNVLTWPFIYGMIIPLFILDVAVSIYQSICFRIYGIKRVIRSDYFYPKRNKLNYLNAIEKMNCNYCGYTNGIIAFTREVFARTEQYWCPIKHASRINGAHERYEKFLKYGENEAFENKLDTLRKDISV